MIACSSVMNIVRVIGHAHRLIIPNIYNMSLQGVSSVQTCQGRCFSYSISNHQRSFQSISFVSSGVSHRRCLEISLACRNINVSLTVPKQGTLHKIKYGVGPGSWQRDYTSAGLVFALFVFCSSSRPVHAEASYKEDSSEAKFSHGKKVYTNYSVTGIPGDGRCLFRSVAHGACLRSGKPAPSESLQQEIADELRDRVADEFVKRREETEWFIEGDFDSYVSQMRKPHTWGGEPELLMISHVLQMPITVYMNDKDSGGLISIAEYGEEYGKDDPIQVLYHGYGHYEALQIPDKKIKSRL